MSLPYNFNAYSGQLAPLFEGNWFEHLSVRHHQPMSTFYLLGEFELDDFKECPMKYSFQLQETKVASSIFEVSLSLVPHGSLFTSRTPFRLREDMPGIPNNLRPFIWSYSNSYMFPVGDSLVIHLSHLSIVEDMFTDIIFNQLDKILETPTYAACALTDYNTRMGTPGELMMYLHQAAVNQGMVRPYSSSPTPFADSIERLVATWEAC